MHAIVVNEFGPPEGLGIGEVAEPMPGADEVLVTVHAAPVNYVDLLVIGTCQPPRFRRRDRGARGGAAAPRK